MSDAVEAEALYGLGMVKPYLQNIKQESSRLQTWDKTCLKKKKTIEELIEEMKANNISMKSCFGF